MYLPWDMYLRSLGLLGLVAILCTVAISPAIMFMLWCVCKVFTRTGRMGEQDE